MIEYIIISGILMVLLVITTLTLTNVLIDRPTDQLSEYAFIDIGNGVSTRIVDLYVIAPIRGNVTTDFDIPDEVAGKEYFVTVSNSPSGDYVRVYRGQLHRDVSLAGIGATLGVGGETSGHGMNRISYRSEGYT